MTNYIRVSFFRVIGALTLVALLIAWVTLYFVAQENGALIVWGVVTFILGYNLVAWLIREYQARNEKEPEPGEEDRPALDLKKLAEEEARLLQRLNED